MIDTGTADETGEIEMATTKTGDTVYQIVMALGGRGWYVNENRWNSETTCYSGNMRATEKKFATRGDAKAWVSSQDESR